MFLINCFLYTHLGFPYWRRWVGDPSVAENFSIPPYQKIPLTRNCPLLNFHAPTKVYSPLTKQQFPCNHTIQTSYLAAGTASVKFMLCITTNMSRHVTHIQNVFLALQRIEWSNNSLSCSPQVTPPPTPLEKSFKSYHWQ